MAALARILDAEAVRAAGGVILREGAGGREVLLVHRPRYDDWTFPKGKALPGEDDAVCALREVEEETGLRCELREELSPVRYRDRRGRAKTVRYWVMSPLESSRLFRPNHEVDDIRWVRMLDAGPALSYERDRGVLGELAEPERA